MKQAVKSELQTKYKQWKVHNVVHRKSRRWERQNHCKQNQNHKLRKKLKLLFEDIIGSSEGNQSAEEIATAEVDRYRIGRKVEQ